MTQAARSRILALALAAAGGGVALVLAFGLFPYHTINHDEAVYLEQANLILHGQLLLHPPVANAFRPWFFVSSSQGLYAKYAPYPAVLYAAGMAVGIPRLALGAVGAAVVGLTYLVGNEVADRRTGLLAAGFVLVSPLFVVDTATFLPYAPVAALNLGFAYAYFRSERTAELRWALLAGALIGLSFFARPYTAVLFAAPFVVHALWTLRRTPTREVIDLRAGTAGLGSLGVALALFYNWSMTGNLLVFPYQAFAPRDGLGFGYHMLRGYGHNYTPSIALRSNAVVVWRFASRWVAGGLLGSAMAAVGLVHVLGRVRRAREGERLEGEGEHRNSDTRYLVLAGLYPSVILGNVYFWGNLNLLAPDLDPTQGLVHYLGPYYHFALLVPTAVFAAVGVQWFGDWIRPRLDGFDSRATVAVVLVVCLLTTAAIGGALAGPIVRNADNTAQYGQGYAPFRNDGPPANSVVFLPTTYGKWLNHPFQSLRNGPEFDANTVYAIDGVNSLDVASAYPNRTYYRYEFRGTWVPTDDTPVHPALRRVRVTSGTPITEKLTVRIPRGADFASLRVATGEGHAYYDLNASSGVHTITLVVNETDVTVSGRGVNPANASTNGPVTVPVNASDDVTATVYVETAPSVGFSYGSRLPVGLQNGTRRALTPYLEACTDPQTCGSGAAYLPGRVPDQYSITATLQGGPRNQSS
ncbi:glycosyltransferase family 39 protein [Haladaptatus sp.]|uniref:DUF7846 domain-containing protein n=1 Tax=Haladaptatus sp. TaxID=1973141 RepID=UPI003C6324FC